MHERDYSDDYDDEEHDWEYPDPDEGGEHEEAEFAECPKCGADVYEEAQRCPLCGEYITPKSQSRSARRNPWMFWATILALLGVGGACLLFPW